MKNVLFILLILFLCQSVQAQDIRVGISNNSFSTYVFNSVNLSADTVYSIYDKDSNTGINKIPADKVSTVEFKDGTFSLIIDEMVIKEGLKGPLTFDSEGRITFCDIKRKGQEALYEGKIELVKAKGDNFNVVNVLDVQTYLKGVVPNEMPVSFGLEALKAQAVAARTYASRTSLNSGKNYQICDSTACQVYFGSNTRSPLSDRAVNETNNIVAIYNGEPILALYSSTAGGYTEDYQNAFSPASKFPSYPIPYLKGVPDNDNQKPINNEDDMRAFLNSSNLSYDSKSPFYRWETTWQREELENILTKTLKEQSKSGFITPQFTQTDEVKGLEKIEVTQRGVSGKAMEIKIKSQNGSWSVKKEFVIRRVFLKGTRALPSANVVFDVQCSDDSSPFLTSGWQAKSVQSVSAKGAGYGHGVGLSQYGAGAMGQSQKKFDEILKHYYSGISLATPPLTLVYKQPSSLSSYEFYLPYNKAYIVFDNSRVTSNIEFTINSKSYKLNGYNYPKKLVKINISEAVRPGLNRVSFKSLNEKDKRLKIWVELSANEQ